MIYKGFSFNKCSSQVGGKHTQLASNPLGLLANASPDPPMLSTVLEGLRHFTPAWRNCGEKDC